MLKEIVDWRLRWLSRWCIYIKSREVRSEPSGSLEMHVKTSRTKSCSPVMRRGAYVTRICLFVFCQQRLGLLTWPLLFIFSCSLFLSHPCECSLFLLHVCTLFNQLMVVIPWLRGACRPLGLSKHIGLHAHTWKCTQQAHIPLTAPSECRRTPWTPH